MIEVRQLDSGYWHVRGVGPCNWSQPPCWPASEDQIRAHAMPEASEEFIREAAEYARRPGKASE